MSEGVPYDALMQSLARMGLDPKDLEFCPVERADDGRVIYRRRRQTANPNEEHGGVLGVLPWRPIAAAKTERYTFIGMVFPDGSIRSDAEILCAGFGEIVIPAHALFYRRTVPKHKRTKLAAFPRESGSSHRPQIIVP